MRKLRLRDVKQLVQSHRTVMGQGGESRSVYAQILLGGDYWAPGSPHMSTYPSETESPGIFFPTSVAAWDTWLWESRRVLQNDCLKHWLKHGPCWRKRRCYGCGAWPGTRITWGASQAAAAEPTCRDAALSGEQPGCGDVKLPGDSNVQPGVRPTH